VKVTGWLTDRLVGDAPTVIVVAVALTVNGAVTLLPVKFVSPGANTALIVYAPAAGKATEHTAVVTPDAVPTGTDAHKGTDEPPLSV
jgi:dipeptide/tripeptide permease